MRSDFAALILTHGRPKNVRTVPTLRKRGYTGRIVIIIDDTDKTGDQYREEFAGVEGVEVVCFDKQEAARTTDTGDNFGGMGAVVYARNASFGIAKSLGLRYFVQLDDDYLHFAFRFNERNEWVMKSVTVKRELDLVFQAFLDFLITTPIVTVAMAQGGDFIGGAQGRNARSIRLMRKAMNSFFCAVERPVGFVGRINEDVNTYTWRTSVGDLMCTHNMMSIDQVSTQQNAGGLTDAYLSLGTYVKSFYTVMWHPSGTRVRMMNSESYPRLHHSVDWSKTAPKILSETTRKPR